MAAIEARIGSGYSWRLIIIAVVCLVFGVWGIYDYAVDIPRRQMLHDRLELLEQSRAALETEQPAGALSEEAAAARAAVQEEFFSVAGRYLQEAVKDVTTPEQMQEALTGIPAPEMDIQWMALLSEIASGLIAPRSLPLTGVAKAAYEQTEAAIDAIGSVTAPAKYDRAMQWAFILCLPCAPWFLWQWIAMRRTSYRLDENGTLHSPAGEWTADDIKDIDMSRWMAKSMATVVNADGEKELLDDYKFKNLHLIVGAIASRLHPDEWDDQAKPHERGDSTNGTPETAA